MKRKQFIKGMTEIAQEGAIQVFKELHIGIEEIIVGVVGVLQFEVLEYRMKNEYNVDIKMERLPYRRSEEHTSELQSRQYLVCRLLLEKKKEFQQKSTRR